MSSSPPLVLHGVDFSAGDNPAGKIWVATRDGRDVELRRGFDHHAIVELVAASAADGRDHLWRIDAPFGVALETLSTFDVPAEWAAMAAWLAGHAGPRDWRSSCRVLSRQEPRRCADRAAHTPMAPLNLRVFKQTWSVITRILVPLAARGIRIEPLAGPTSSRVVVAEGCPASALHLRGWPARGYKGSGEPPRARRAEILAKIRAAGVPVTTKLGDRAIEDTEGDGLDALLLLLPPEQTVVPAEALVEGWVY